MPRRPNVTDHLPTACFAPPLDEAKLGRYRGLIASAQVDAETKDALQSLLRCVEAWWDAPESDRTDGDKWKVKVPFHEGKRVRNGGGSLPPGAQVEYRDVLYRETPLTEALKKQLFETTPWMSELERLSNSRDEGLLDQLPRGELRHAAHHLVWFARELTLDREPLTDDLLGE